MIHPLAQITGGGTVQTVLFYCFALLSGTSAVLLVASRSIVRMAVCLLFALLGVAGLYFLLHAEFLAAVQLVVYAGGTLILIIFGVMLTSTSPYSRFEATRTETIVATIAALCLLASLVAAIGLTFADPPSEPSEPYSILTLGQALLGDYLVPFEIASVLLLVVMIGAAYLAKARRREGEP